MSAPPPSTTGEERSRRLAPLLVFCAYVMFVAAWTFGSPPSAAPDEWHHYLRAVSIGRGQLVGTSGGLDAAKDLAGPRGAFESEEFYREKLATIAQSDRWVHIPAGLTPGWFRCPQVDPNVSAGCFNGSPPLAEAHDWFISAAIYEPLPFLVPAALSRISLQPDNLTRLMRAGKVLVSLPLLGAAMFLLWEPRARLTSLVGLLVAITPMVVFLSGSLNPSGMEILAAITFTSALLRLTRGENDYPFTPWAWAFAGVGGFFLALTRTEGPVWIVAIACITALLADITAFPAMARRWKRWAASAATLVIVAMLLNRIWEHIYGLKLEFDITPLRASLTEGLSQMPRLLMEHVGVFNYLEVVMPWWAYDLWRLLAVSLVAVALLVGTRWQRLVLFASVAAVLVVPVLLVAATMRHTGFGAQGRYLLPFSIIVPLIAGEIVVRRFDRVIALDARRLFLPFAAIAGFVHLVAWWTNAHRFAVGVNGRQWFLASPEWSPPLGWAVWLMLVIAGICLLVSAGLLEFRQDRSGVGS